MLENPKGSPFQFFSALWDFFPKIKVFLSSIFWCFATEWMLINPKGPPFQFFRIVRLFSKICFFSKESPLQLRQKCWQFRKCPLLERQGFVLAGPGAPLGPFFLLFWFSSTVNWLLEVFLLFFGLGYGPGLFLRYMRSILRFNKQEANILRSVFCHRATFLRENFCLVKEYLFRYPECFGFKKAFCEPKLLL